MDQVRSRPDLCGAFCMNGDKERAQPSRPQQFSFSPLFAPVSASWLGSLAALSAATRTRAPKRATGIQKPSHRGPAFGEARFSLTQQSTGLLLPVSTPRWGVRKPEFVSSHLIPFAPQKTRPPIGWSCFLCDCPPLLLSVNQLFLSCISDNTQKIMCFNYLFSATSSCKIL